MIDNVTLNSPIAYHLLIFEKFIHKVCYLKWFFDNAWNFTYILKIIHPTVLEQNCYFYFIIYELAI